MTLFEKIIEAFPELQGNANIDRLGIILQNDSDGTGDYIAKWEYSQPLPETLTTYMRGSN